ncbi:hypothetical protein CRN76_06480 [Chryseobacterium indologenes]|uniref:hypothetical protein n=1 Tax=Chryseobacterium TaxID=59732 RepID=UPI0004890AD5|nr:MULTISPECIES: hypothetical protein [Chryseobacterium]ASE60964.1 hypothetical protein CEQ15_05340 [Chryseobacterium indologenes]ATN05074.1 hypothetical protein CRN76_06480 [Chryseobacterium indologenes]AYY86173.1 hypothetical protein EGX91_17270 [Chryseobacterium indologenes]QIX83075.1 hypothetical protein FOB56_18305 [Chryseobacterium indologenes]TLX24556.1 hypothetical protein FE904_15775 [Chryseobacterium indologenes]
MEEFEIPVKYKGKELVFKGRLATFTYGYKLYVDIDGNEVAFERDDEGNLRALVQENSSNSPVDKELIQSIIEVFQGR